MMKFFERKEIKLLMLAILIRLLIMPFYFHPDIKTYHFQSSFLKQGVFDIYSYLENKKSELPLKEEFVYFPLTYFFLGAYQFIATPILGGSFNSWLSDASIGAAENIGVFRYLFILKFPYLILDILIAYLLKSFFQTREEKERVFNLWLFNPFSIILIYIFSNVDIIAVAFTLVSILLAQKKRLILAALCLGLGAGFKAYPLIFLPILFIFAKDIKEKFVISVVALGSFLLVIAPFITSPAFRQTTLLSGLTTRILLPIINLGFDETLFVALIPISILIFTVWFNSNKDTQYISYYFFAILALVFPFIHYHIQWLLWIIPFAVLIIVRNENLKGFLVLLGVLAFSIPLLYNDKSMSVALLRPFSLWYEQIPIPYEIVSKVYNPIILQSILHSVLAGASLTAVWRLLKQS